MNFVSSLQEATLENLAECGGKAAYLGEALRLGCNVPDGIVLSTELYRRFMWQRGLQGEVASIFATMQPTTMSHFLAAEWAIQEAFKVRRIPDEVLEAIRDAWRAMGGIPIVVRASATNEGSPRQSFVGQHWSCLDCPTEEAAIKSVMRCWMSLFDAKALSYAYHFGINLLNSSMAVLFQRKIEPTSRGALFTVDPISGNPDVFVLEISDGPRKGVHRLDPYQRQPGEPSTWTQLRYYGMLLDEHHLAYQAIEFATVNERAYVLRVRPATRIPRYLPVSPGEIAQGEGPPKLVHPSDTTPRALRPYSWYHRSRWPRLNVAYFRGAHRLFVPYSGRDEYYVRGYLYARWRQQSISLSEGQRSTVAYVLLSLRRLRAAQDLDREFSALYKDQRRRLDEVNRLELPHLPDEELSRILQEVMSISEAFYAQRGHLGEVDRALMDLLTRLHRSWVGDAADLRKLLEAGENHRMRFDVELCELARAPLAREEDRETAFRVLFHQYRHLFLRGAPVTEEQDICTLQEDEAEAQAAWRTRKDSPGKGPCDDREGMAQEQDDAERKAMARVGPLRAPLFRHVLQLARRYAPLHLDRDEPVLLSWILERDIVRDVGRRLKEQRLGRSTDDSSLLTYREMIDWLEHRMTRDSIVHLLMERRDLYRHWWRYAPPETLEEEGATGSPVEPTAAADSSEGKELSGLAVSPGVGQGRAHRIYALGEMSNVLPGEVLILREPLFEFSPLFGIISAVVSETGGLLDHAAVLAREYGVPAVFGVTGAMAMIENGEQVRVDALRGVVTRYRVESDWELL